MAEDPLTRLDRELAALQDSIVEDVGRTDSQKQEVVKTMIDYFWKIWIRFDRIKAHFTMDPSPNQWATFTNYPESWEFKDRLNFLDISKVSLTDKSQDQGRMGDSIQAWFYNVDKVVHLRIVFEYCDGEHYYKFSGWKRIFAQQILYDQPLDKTKPGKLWELLSDVIKIWFESHLRRNRELIIKYVKEHYEKGETFTD